MPIVPTPSRDIFASAARPDEIQVFPNWTRGWGLTFDPGQTEGIPPMEWMNGAFNQISSGLAYLLQRGVAPYDSNEDYQAGSAVTFSGDIWLALRANKNVLPGTSSADWKGIFAGLATKLDTNGKAADTDKFDGQDSANFVQLAGAQTISGAKTFTGAVKLPPVTVFAKQGIEGAQIELETGTDSTITGRFAIDLSGSSLNFFETGGTCRGATLPIAKLPAVSTAEILTTNRFRFEY